MSRISEELSEEFDVESEDGQRFRLEAHAAWQEIQPMGPQSPKCLPTGMKRFQTTTGQVCNRIDEDTYVIVERNLQVKRINTH